MHKLDSLQQNKLKLVRTTPFQFKITWKVLNQMKIHLCMHVKASTGVGSNVSKVNQKKSEV